MILPLPDTDCERVVRDLLAYMSVEEKAGQLAIVHAPDPSDRAETDRFTRAIREGRVTAVESVAIGTDWTFDPALSIPRDGRWGRTYEGYSEGPEIAGRLGAAYTIGLQGDPARHFFPAGSIIATAKHMVADGGTANGRDQGDALVNEAELRDIHWAPYVPT